MTELPEETLPPDLGPPLICDWDKASGCVSVVADVRNLSIATLSSVAYQHQLPSDLQGACEGRRKEFLTGRYLAGWGLARLGCKQPHVGRDGRRPVWPAGFKGSLSHAKGIIAALVAPAEACQSLGIDCEVIQSAAAFSKIAHKILSDGEAALLREYPWDWGLVGTIAFCAKESFYKGLNPLTDRFFGFHDAAITAITFDANKSAEAGTVNIQLTTTLAPAFAEGFRAVMDWQVIRSQEAPEISLVTTRFQCPW